MVEANETQRISIPLSNPEVLHDSRGRVQWKLPGNTVEENEQLAIRNIQGLFLKKFPEFNELFPREDGVIAEDKREDAEKYILDKVGTQDKFSFALPSTSLHPRSVPAFGGSFNITLGKSFRPWGIHFSNLSHPPEGWINNYALSMKLAREEKTVNDLADKLKVEHPEWYREYTDKIGNRRVHYSPQLADQIKKELSRYSSAPEGWIVNSALSNSLDVAGHTIKGIAINFRETNPDWFKDFRGTKGVREYYSPELIDKIKEKLGSHDRLLKGWVSMHTLVVSLKRGQLTLEAVIDKYREDHPEWFKEFRGKIVTEYYSPELQAKLNEELPKFGKPQEGWINNKTLHNKLGFSEKKVKFIADKFKASHPEWFREYSARRGKQTLCYSPELVAKISEELLKDKDSPEGWFANNQLAAKLEIQRKILKVIAGEFKNKHPEWFDKFRQKKGKVLEFYSPELVSEITRIVKERKEQKEKDNITPEEAENMFRELMGK